MEQHDRTQSHARSLVGLFESAKAQVNALQEEVSQLSAELQISQATAEELEAVGDRLAATHALTRHMLQEAEARSLQLEQGQVLAPFRSTDASRLSTPLDVSHFCDLQISRSL